MVRRARSTGELHAVGRETLCVVGESGCGKSVTALATMGLLPARLGAGRRPHRLEGRDLLGLDSRRWPTCAATGWR